ncbi:MAG TPA: gluconate 2-dehydrogenase subunit 3 family protein [Rhodothermales bacterium]|nr:gluconate 2-dehydrogenase subunit 3 family protein [Rhodothermales bacterium]
MDRREAIKHVAFMLGGVISAPNLTALLARPGDGLSALPSALAPDQREMVAVIAEHIIPATDTPGARGVGVHRFIDRLVTESYTPEDRDHFLQGLSGVDAASHRAFGKGFLELTPGQQRDLLDILDRQAYDYWPSNVATTTLDLRERIEGSGEETLSGPVDPDTETASERTYPSFFGTMKELTLVGYYTSEAGATEELRHVPIPGRYDGCIPFSEVGRTWAV